MSESIKIDYEYSPTRKVKKVEKDYSVYSKN